MPWSVSHVEMRQHKSARVSRENWIACSSLIGRKIKLGNAPFPSQTPLSEAALVMALIAQVYFSSTLMLTQLAL